MDTGLFCRVLPDIEGDSKALISVSVSLLYYDQRRYRDSCCSPRLDLLLDGFSYRKRKSAHRGLKF